MAVIVGEINNFCNILSFLCILTNALLCAYMHVRLSGRAVDSDPVSITGRDACQAAERTRH